MTASMLHVGLAVRLRDRPAIDHGSGGGGLLDFQLPLFATTPTCEVKSLGCKRPEFTSTCQL